MTNHGSSHVEPSSEGELRSKNRATGPQQTVDSDHGVAEARTVITRTAQSGPISEQQTVISKKQSESDVVSAAPVKANELGRFLEGEVLDHFRLDEFIGGGGMGAVFRAHDTKLSRTVAVKVLSRGQQADEDTRARFQLEAQSAARLDHENIARVYYVGESEGWDYIVFEYIDGVNIRDLVASKGPLSLEDAVSFTLQVAEALQHASRRDVVHRDIKPSNVLITDTGRAKLVDMGLARLHQVEVGHEELTVSGVTLGTFDYISPEQARDPRHADVRSDMYSLGCTLFYMLAGRPPFSDGTVLQKLLSHTSDEPPDIRHFRPSVPREVMTVLRKMLAKSPDDRHRTPSELIGELLLLTERLGLSSSGQAGTVWMSPANPSLTRWERHVPWVVPVLLFVAVVVGVDYLTQGPNVKATRPRNAITTPSVGTVALDGYSVREEEQAGRRSSDPNDQTPSVSSIPRILVVGDANDRPDAAQFNTLDEALAYLANHRNSLTNLEAIELCFTGRRQRPQQPIEFDAPLVVIRAGAGYEPVIAFRPEDSAKSSMITLTGGELAMRGIHLEVDLQEPVDHWTLFDLQGAARVDLSSCTLTMRNNDSQRRTYFEAVAFFHIEPSPAFQLDEEGDAHGMPTHIQMRDCLVRGEATLLWAMEARPFEFEWVNGILISTERLLRASGRSTPIDRDQAIQIHLEDVTAVVDKGLFSMSANEHASHAIKVDIDCENSVFVTAAGTPLIEQRGPAPAEELKQQLIFRGQHNVFVTEPVAGKETTYWRMVTSGENTDTVDLGFSAWYHLFSSADDGWYEVGITPLTLPFLNRPAHQLTAEDYAWRRILTAREFVNYSLDAGCRAQHLPMVPVDRKLLPSSDDQAQNVDPSIPPP